MTAWDILTAGSSATAGSTAWVHLNSQTIGVGGDCPATAIQTQSFTVSSSAISVGSTAISASDQNLTVGDDLVIVDQTECAC